DPAADRPGARRARAVVVRLASRSEPGASSGAREETMLKRVLWTDNNPAELVMRLALGAVMFPHGAQKVFGWVGGGGGSVTVPGLPGMGLPPWLTVLVMAFELGGSILLILGLLTRLAALGIGCVMAGAWITVHAKVGFFMNWAGSQKGEGFEY